MSVYKREGQETFSYDFSIRGDRYSGHLETANRREAERLESAIKDKVKADRAKANPAALLTLKDAILRYWKEVGQHHSAKVTTARDMARLQDFFGASMALAAIDDDEVSRLVAWRRGQTVKNRAGAKLLAPATVNRSTIEPLQKLFSRARKHWRVALPIEPIWGNHLLDEPKERVRWVRPGEEALLRQSVRADYLPLVAFARAAGMRQKECLLRKEQVDLTGGYVRTIGKGGKLIELPITAEMRAILMAEMANPTEYVFTYRARRAERAPKKGHTAHAKGDRLPITASGLKTQWRRARAHKEGPRLPADLRFHDMRHDFGTTLLRDSGNLRLVQRALGHSNIATTTKYAHVVDEDLAAAMESASKRRREQ